MSKLKYPTAVCSCRRLQAGKRPLYFIAQPDSLGHQVPVEGLMREWASCWP